jgi:hypothetical protein
MIERDRMMVCVHEKRERRCLAFRKRERSTQTLIFTKTKKEREREKEREIIYIDFYIIMHRQEDTVLSRRNRTRC